MKAPKGIGTLLSLGACVLGGYLLGQSKPLTGFGSGSCPVCQLVNWFGQEETPTTWPEVNPRPRIESKYRRNIR